MKEIIDHLKENRQIELAKSILESHGYTVSRRNESISSEKLDESYKWYRTEDGYYMVKGYFDENGEGDLPVTIPERDGKFIAMLSGNDYKGKSFDNLESAQSYIEHNVSPESIAKYATDEGPWNW